MKRLFSSSVAAVLAAGMVWGATLNDGTSTQGLVHIINSVNDFEGYTLLTEASNGVLQAEQVGDASPVLKTAWYHESATATNRVYTVTADFLPGYPNAPECRGGVIGWLDTVASNGIVLQIVPPGIASSSFRLSCVDFLHLADDQSHLYNLDGSTADSSSAWSEIKTNYAVTDFATFELAFTNPAPADLAALSNATARVRARVWQGIGTNRVQVSETIELLTDLPVPPDTRHRVGYFGVWASAWPGDVIGYFDELTVEGGVFMQNIPPSVTLTQPAGGTVYTAPATVPLAATASDIDGSIARVEFYSDGTNRLATLTQAPFVANWANAQAGTYVIHAVATDNEGASVTTPPVTVIVNALPTVQVTSPRAGTSFVEPATILVEATAVDADGAISRVDFYAGTTLLGSDDTSPFSWTWNDVAAGTYALTAQAIDNHGATNTSTAVSITVTRQSGEGPALSVAVVGDTVTVSWGVTGYELQYKTTLAGGTWEVVPGSSNLTQYDMKITGAATIYFRLVGSGTPSGPLLSAGLSGNQVVITWPSAATGYRLQARDNLENAVWQDVTTSGNQYTEPTSTAVRRFFRLVQ